MNQDQDEILSTISDDEERKITLVAKSITSLAQAVKELQSQMKEIDERLLNQETLVQEFQQSTQPSPPSSSSSLSTIVAALEIQKKKKKKKDFIKAYKAVISIAKALKQLPEIKEELTGVSSAICSIRTPESTTTSKSFNHLDDQITAASSSSSCSASNVNILRNIALSLSDVDTVTSFVSHDGDDDEHNDEISLDEGSSLHSAHSAPSLAYTRIQGESTIVKSLTSKQQKQRRQKLKLNNSKFCHENIGKDSQQQQQQQQIELLIKKHSERSLRLHLGITCIFVFSCLGCNLHSHYISDGMNTNNMIFSRVLSLLNTSTLSFDKDKEQSIDNTDTNTATNSTELNQHQEKEYVNENIDKRDIFKTQENNDDSIEIHPDRDFCENFLSINVSVLLPDTCDISGHGYEYEWKYEHDYTEDMIESTMDKTFMKKEDNLIFTTSMEEMTQTTIKDTNTYDTLDTEDFSEDNGTKNSQEERNVLDRIEHQPIVTTTGTTRSTYLCDSYEDSSIISLSNLCEQSEHDYAGLLTEKQTGILEPKEKGVLFLRPFRIALGVVAAIFVQGFFSFGMIGKFVILKQLMF